MNHLWEVIPDLPLLDKERGFKGKIRKEVFDNCKGQCKRCDTMFKFSDSGWAVDHINPWTFLP
jgi:5-methylcytosine-specific restriction endonuclease McrA